MVSLVFLTNEKNAEILLTNENNWIDLLSNRKRDTIGIGLYTSKTHKGLPRLKFTLNKLEKSKLPFPKSSGGSKGSYKEMNAKANSECDF